MYSTGSYFCFYLNFLMIINLKTLPSNAIDSQKWDNCIAINYGLIYATKSYLDFMADKWLGIIVNDYEAVFPICLKQKLGIKYTYTPAFIQQLGLLGYGSTGISDQLFENLKKEVLSKVKFGDIHFNHQNSFVESFCIPKTNFIIDLKDEYLLIYNRYKNDLKQNLKKAAKENFIYKQDNDVAFAIEIYKKNYRQRMTSVTDTDFENFKNLCLKLQQTNNCIVRKVLNQQNEVLAIALLLIDNHRIYNIANSNTTLGRTTEANHFLLDGIIKEFAGSNLIFDFEGSDLPGVKQFYQKFGTVNQPYYHWHFNNLPWFIKLFKK